MKKCFDINKLNLHYGSFHALKDIDKYDNIAIVIGQLLGFDIKDNFNKLYLA